LWFILLFLPRAVEASSLATRAFRSPVAAWMNSPDYLAVLAKAYEWALRIIVVSFEMVLPGVVGYWVDLRLGTVCLFLVLGLLVGSYAGMRHLLKVTRQDSDKDRVAP
jgi:F0F1-type ATP synthase assembly protein I